MTLIMYTVPIKSHPALPNGIGAFDEETKSLYLSPEDWEDVQEARGNPVRMKAVSDGITIVRIPNIQKVIMP